MEETKTAHIPYNPSMRPLPRSFYNRKTVEVAKDLLGKLIVRRDGDAVRIGKVVETEAYLGPHDLAAHSARGRTPRTEVMFGPPGHAYVYLIYGMHHCLNIVTEEEGHASAVLIRALEPVRNLLGRSNGPGLLCKAMGIDRSLNGHDLAKACHPELNRKCHGEPRRTMARLIRKYTLCKTSSLDGARSDTLDGAHHDTSSLVHQSIMFIAEPEEAEEFVIIKRPRVGVAYAGARWSRRLLRFSIKGNPCVSKA